MGNNTGMLPFNGHRIQGRSSKDFLDTKEIINSLNLKGNEIFMDCGCGDGHIAITVSDILSNESLIYAVDIFEPSIQDLEKFVEKEKITNVVPLVSDISKHIDVDDNTIDICLLVNVFHGFKARRVIDEAILELKRIIKPKIGKIVIMDYKKQKAKHGPPFPVRSSPEELEEIFNKHGLKLIFQDNEVGEDIKEGKSHYLLSFSKD